MSKNPNELKCKCGATIFNIFTKSECGNCKHNGAFNDDVDQYVYGEDADKLDRTSVEDEGECQLGYSHGKGCHRYLCASCGKIKSHLPLMEG